MMTKPARARKWTSRSKSAPLSQWQRSARAATVDRTVVEHDQCHARESGHPDLAARAGALDSRFRGNDTTLKDLILNDARDDPICSRFWVGRRHSSDEGDAQKLESESGDGAGLTGGGRRCVRHICGRSVTKVPICKDAYDNGETYEKRKPCRGVIPNGLRITAFCSFGSVQLLGCHCQFPPSRTKRPRVNVGFAGSIQNLYDLISFAYPNPTRGKRQVLANPTMDGQLLEVRSLAISGTTCSVQKGNSFGQ